MSFFCYSLLIPVVSVRKHIFQPVTVHLRCQMGSLWMWPWLPKGMGTLQGSAGVKMSLLSLDTYGDKPKLPFIDDDWIVEEMIVKIRIKTKTTMIQELEVGEPERREDGTSCSLSEQSRCNRIDINLVCTQSVDGTHSCRCRRDMEWNSRTLECQMFLDVDCMDLKYTYAPSKEIDAAALRLEHKLRGLTKNNHKKPA